MVFILFWIRAKSLAVGDIQLSLPPTPSLPFLDLGEVARPRRTDGDGRNAQYHWRTGHPLPDLGKHSVAKHNIYEHYLGRYIDTLTRHHSQTNLTLTIIDGFCGGGLYNLDGIEADGSPLRMLAVVDNAQAKLAEARAKGFTIKCDFIFIDQDPDHLAFLQELLKERGYGDRIGKDIILTKATFENAAPGVIERIKRRGTSHRSLFFVDQYGWSAVKLATIKRIMEELANPEVVLTFMVDALINLMHEKSSVRALAAIELARGDVQEMIRERGKPGWKSLIQNTLYRHIQAHTGANFYSPFYIHPPESHRDYWLLHLSKHHTAREEMGKVYWAEQNTMEHFGGPALNALGYDPLVDVRQGEFAYVFDDDAKQRSESRLLEQIPRLLHALGSDGRSVSRRDLFAGQANDTPIITSMLDSRLALLRDSGEITIQGRRKTADGAIVPTDRVSASSYEWHDEFTLTPQPAMFLMPRMRGPADKN